jgi:hypothetical protein
VSTTCHPLDQVGIRFAAAGGVLVAAVGLPRLAGLDELGTLGVVLVSATVLGATVTPGLAATLGITAWALFTGFVVNDYGLLTFAPADLGRLVVLVLVPALLSGLAVGTGVEVDDRPRRVRGMMSP